MARPEEYDRDQMINRIWQAKGKVSAAAQALGCNPKTIFDYARKYATVREAIEQARLAWDEGLIDMAEVKLYEAVTEGKPWAVRYALETKGRGRGYVTRSETAIMGPDGGPVRQEHEVEVRVDLSELSDEDLARLAAAFGE